LELFRVAKNVWGQEILLGISWDFLWVPIALAFCFIVAHQVIRFIKI
jgi:hypothetical protein